MFKKFFAKRKKTKVTIIIVVLLAIAITVLVILGNRNKGPQYTTVSAVRQNLLQTVSETGAVKSAQEINLSFPTGGKLISKAVKLGDEVIIGQEIAQLDHQSLDIQKNETESNLSAMKASLSKLLVGASSEQIAVTEAQVSEAQKAYQTAQDNLSKLSRPAGSLITPTAYEQAVISATTNLANIKITYQQAINNNTDTSFSDVGAKLPLANTALDNVKKMLDDGNIKIGLSSLNSSFLSNTQSGYDSAEILLATANASLTTTSQDKSQNNVKQALTDTLNCLKKTSDVLNDSYNALKNSTGNQTALDSYKAIISAQMSYISASLNLIQADSQNLDSAYLAYSNNVSSAENSLRQAQSALNDAISSAQNASIASSQAYELAKKQLAQLKAPARTEDIILSQANVEKAQTDLDLVNKQLADSVLKSPINGRIVRDDFEVGEQVSALQPAFAVLEENQFEIEVDISESDIAKIKEGNKTAITFDAFGEDQKFSGQVLFIEPAETIIQDVVYYKVKIGFSETPERLALIKSGMTANVVITTDSRDNVIVIPERAIISKDSNSKIVRILRGDDNKIVESPVKVGLRGDDGLTEILSGVAEGDKVVTYVKL